MRANLRRKSGIYAPLGASENSPAIYRRERNDKKFFVPSGRLIHGKGISIIEVLVAIVVISLTFGPIIHLLSASNKVSNASAYEVMASHYASEAGEQLQRMAPRLKELRLKTGKTVEQILTDPSFETLIGPGGGPSGEPYMARLPVPDPTVTDVALFLSPLDPAFTQRKFLVNRLNNTDGALQVMKTGSGEYWDVTIILAWKLQPDDPIYHGASYSVILREDP